MWSEISQEHHNGKVLGYSISYRAECSDDHSSVQIKVDIAVKSYTITGLRPGTRYNILIAGYTAQGVGNERHMELFTRK